MLLLPTRKRSGATADDKGHRRRPGELARDLRSAILSLARRPFITIGAALSLALCVALNVTIYNVVRQMFFDSWIAASGPETLDMIGPEFSYLNFRDLRSRVALRDVAAWQAQIVTWGSDEGTSLVTIGVVTPNFFDVIGVRPLHGSVFRAAGDALTSDVADTAVLDYAFWRQRFGGDPAVIGQVLSLNGWSYRVVGVLPADFYSTVGPLVSPALYVPLSPWIGRGLYARKVEQFLLYGRRPDGMSRAVAGGAVRTAMQQLERDFPNDNRDLAAELTYQPADQSRGASEMPPPVTIAAVGLFVLVTLIIVVAAINVAGLLAARAIERCRELADGAERSRLVQQLIIEGLVLAMVGCGAGAALAMVLPKLASLVAPNVNLVPVSSPLWYALGLTLLVTVLCGVAPTMVVSRPPAPRLRSDSSASLPWRWRAARALVVLQVATACLLLNGAAMLLTSLVRYQATNPGFDVTHTLLVQLRFPTAPPGAPPRTPAEYRKLLEQLPGAEMVSYVGNIPLGAQDPPRSRVRGGSIPERDVLVITNAVGPRYLEILGIPLRAGRDFTEDDLRLDSHDETPIVVNETFAKRVLHTEHVLNLPIEIESGRGTGRYRAARVVGLAADSKMQSLDEESAPVVYLPGSSNLMVARVHGRAIDAIPAWRRMLPRRNSVASLTLSPMSERIDAALGAFRSGTLILVGLGGLALVLAMVGLHGIVSYSARGGRREIGISVPRAAMRRPILRLVANDALSVVGWGIGVGALLSLGLIVVLRPALAGGPALYALIVLPTIALLIVLGLAASVPPAWRPATAEPISATRHE